MLAVATEKLVGALARERHGDVLRGELGEREKAECRQIRDRLVHEPDSSARSTVSSTKDNSSSWCSVPKRFAT